MPPVSIPHDMGKIDELQRAINSVIVGNEDCIHHLLIALLAEGHVLLEGVPGIAKTTLIKTIANAVDLSFKRIQFTPDLLPSDLIGTLIYNAKTGEFETKKGPLFAHIILADEINRAPAKVQSALLEVMQEHQVTIGSHTYMLEKPYIVFATQNPIEQAGTYQLPEAQRDRFMFKLLNVYPTATEEREIVRRSTHAPTVPVVITAQDLRALRTFVDSIYCDEKIVTYIVDIVQATRSPHPHVLYGASPRASLALYKSARARAFILGRLFVIPDDIKALAPAVLRHRIGLSYDAHADGITPDIFIKELIARVPTP